MAVVLGMTVPILTVSGAVTVQAAGGVSECLPVATTALDSLCVESSTNGSTTAPYDTTVRKGDRIDDFKWLVNEDDSTGDPSFTQANVHDCLPACVQPTAHTADAGLAIYQTAGSGDLANCPWPSIHASSGHSTVISNGDQGDIASLANLDDGNYLISVLADDYKIDGVHFKVRGGASVLGGRKRSARPSSCA